MQTEQSPGHHWEVVDKATLSLNCNNSWSRYGALVLNITVSTPKVAMVFYNVTTWTDSAAEFYTRLMHNGGEEQAARCVSADSKYHSNVVNFPLVLEPGSHTFEVQYRTPGRGDNRELQDWNQTHLRVVLP